MNSNFLEDSLIVLTKPMIDKMLEYECRSDLIALYTFYYYTAKWQKTNITKCTTSYTAKGLNWTETRVRKSKKILEEIGLIKDFARKDEHGKITGHYIIVSYILKKSTEDKINNDYIPHCGKNDSVENPQTNSLSINNTNALNTNKENACIEKFKNLSKSKQQKLNSIEKQCELYDIDNEEVIEKILTFFRILLENNKMLSNEKINATLNDLAKLNTEKQIEILDLAIKRGWQSIDISWLNNKKDNDIHRLHFTPETEIKVDEKDNVRF